MAADAPLFSAKPIWTSGTRHCGGDGNARWIDVDGDGDPDLPVYCLAIFENKGGTISKKVSRTVGPREYSESSIFADFDSDGDLDIIATYPKRGTVVLYKNDGKGEFGKGTVVYHDRRVGQVQRVYCLNVDKDGVKEIFCAKGPWGPPGRSLGLAQVKGATTMKVIWRSGGNTGFHGFDFRDVDGDLDLAVGAINQAMVFENLMKKK